MGDHDRQATAVSIVVAIKPLGFTWYRVLFFGARHIPWITAAMRNEKFIHFCHWMVVRDVPSASGSTRRLPRAVLWFESNYDGEVVRYMDTFARIIPWRMRAAWTPTMRFPDMFPSGPFHQWTLDNAYENSHYWSAYPDATTRDVDRALTVSRSTTDFGLDKARSPEEFADRWRRFLAANQGAL